jgi:Predicted membrane protein (DUF2142)
MSALHRSVFALWIFAGFAMVIGAWSLASPLMSGPDEPGHVNEAAAAVRGEIDVGHRQQLSSVLPWLAGSVAIVRVPEWVAQADRFTCSSFSAKTVPPNCAGHLGDQTKEVDATTQFSNYPPLYYFLVGWPSALWTGARALYLMRFVGALVNAAFLGLGVALLARYHPKRLPLLGALVALTPMVFFVSSVINSSGLEIASAFAAWCGGLCIVARSGLPRLLIICTSISFAVLILSRPISPVNALIIVAVLSMLVEGPRLRTLAHDKGVRKVLGTMVAAGAIAVGALAVGGLPVLTGVKTRPLSPGGSVWLTIRLTLARLKQCIGAFSGETFVPYGVILVWVSAVGGLLTLALFTSSRGRRALLVLGMSILALPIVFESPQINAVGTYWQGRYWLPLAIGIPLVASSCAVFQSPSALFARRSARVLGVLAFVSILAIAQLAAILTELHRYETGLDQPPGAPIRWLPPGGSTLVVALFLLGEALLVAFLLWQLFFPGWRVGLPLLPSGGSRRRADSVTETSVMECDDAR